MTTTATDETARVVRAYYASWERGADTFDAASVRELFAQDLRFHGPIAGERVGAEGFVKGLSNFVGVIKAPRMRHLLVDGEKAAALYDAELPGGDVRFAEFFEVRDGRIQALELMYDAAEYVKRGGR